MDKYFNGKTEARGLRLNESLWDDLEGLAGDDKRTLNQYIALVLINHVTKKKMSKSEIVNIKSRKNHNHVKEK